MCVYVGIKVSRGTDTHEPQNPPRFCPPSTIISTAERVQQKGGPGRFRDPALSARLHIRSRSQYPHLPRYEYNFLEDKPLQFIPLIATFREENKTMLCCRSFITSTARVDDSFIELFKSSAVQTSTEKTDLFFLKEGAIGRRLALFKILLDHLPILSSHQIRFLD